MNTTNKIIIIIILIYVYYNISYGLTNQPQNTHTIMPPAFSINIEKATIKNNNYRKVIYTDPKQQIVLMSLNPGEYIHRETHKGTQFFRIEKGTGVAEIGKTRKKIKLGDGISLSVPPNVLHKLINTSKTQALKIYTIYSPPVHKHGEIDKRQPEDDM